MRDATSYPSALAEDDLQLPRFVNGLLRLADRMSGGRLHDLSWRVNRARKYRHALAQAVSNMTQGVCLYDRNDRLRLVNEQFCRIYNQPLSTLRIGMTFREMLANSIAAGNYAGRTIDDVWLARKAFIDQCKPGTFLQELGDGRLISISHQPLNDGGWVATYEDITELRRAELQARFMAQHDALTKLPNRVLLAEKLEACIAQARQGIPCVLLCLDLDGFKLVNDRLGHAAGDALLCEVAARLKRELREDDLAARLGGDEFAVLLPRTRATTALRVAERLGASLNLEYMLERYGPAQIGASVGIACAPEHAQDADTLMSFADKALYAAKRSRLGVPRLYDARLLHPNAGAEDGSERRRPEPAALSALRAAAAMANDLRVALQLGHLDVHYQPIVSAASGEPVAFEVVARWTDPQKGSISPDAFIPAAEETGFIVPMMEWVLRRVCTEAASWPIPHRVTVNLSSINFSQPDLVEMVAGILAETRFPADRLVLELTESLLLNVSDAVLETLERLGARGVQIWLDDFGKGYANFALLQALPFTAIKIDRSFLRTGPRRAAIMRSMVQLGHACGFKVVAEGIETAEQRDQMKELCCDYLQGYFFGRPGRHYMPRLERRSVTSV